MSQYPSPLGDAIGELTADLAFQRAVDRGELSDQPLFDSEGMEAGIYRLDENKNLEFVGTQDAVIDELDEMYRQAIIAADNDYLDD